MRALVLVVAVAGCSVPPAMVRQQQKVELVGGMQRDLLQSVEAEKSAVLAVTDPESSAFAEESKQASAAVETARLEVHRLVEDEGRPGELQQLAGFDAAWAELREIDARLLALAVANTNLKASRLAAGDCAAAVNQLVDALAALEAATAEPRVLRELSGAAVSALRIQALLAPHIASPADAEMSALEEQMRGLAAKVDVALANARKGAPAPAKERAAEAWESWARYQRLTAEVVRLSRLNTNVLSFDLSVHQKRRATLAAQSALGGLLREIQDVPRPSR